MQKISYLFVLTIVSVQVFGRLGSAATVLFAMALGAKDETVNSVLFATEWPLAFVGEPFCGLPIERLLPGPLSLIPYLVFALLIVRRLAAHIRDHSIVPPASYGKASDILAKTCLGIFSAVMPFVALAMALRDLGLISICGLLLFPAQLCGSMSFIITEARSFLVGQRHFRGSPIDTNPKRKRGGSA
jgi:hypothetical protein